MKIINSIKFVLLLLGIGNLNLSFAQADLLDQQAQFNQMNPKNILKNEKTWENEKIKQLGKPRKKKQQENNSEVN